MNATCKQRVIVYDDPKKGTVVYATAYDEEEGRHQLLNCARQYGRNANVRSLLADELPPPR